MYALVLLVTALDRSIGWRGSCSAARRAPFPDQPIFTFGRTARRAADQGLRLAISLDFADFGEPRELGELREL